MNSLSWKLSGVFGLLLVIYAVFFTEWLRPAPIEIASQIRFAIQPPRFGKPQAKTLSTTNGTHAATNKIVKVDSIDRIGRPESGMLDQAPGGVANVTFSFDAFYVLTSVKVQDVPADGSAPRVVWQLTGKSHPTESLLYNRIPEGMSIVGTSTNGELLQAGVPYQLIVEAGRRRGTNRFSTIALNPSE